jgi:hypothetical protein
MGKEDSHITAAACRYLLAVLLPRLERAQPGLLAEMRAGIAGDRDAMAAGGSLLPDVEATVSEALRLLDVAGTK